MKDQSQGVQLATMKALVGYWHGNYDWRKVEARLNALPQFISTIDGVDIHFIHVRSKYPNALPVIITHGWTGSIIEQLKIIGPLTDPVAHGGKAEDAFDVVIPSLPGHGFSGKPTTTGWDPIRIARAWTVLMKRLGYTTVCGSRWRLGKRGNGADGAAGPSRTYWHPHHMPATVPDDVGKALQFGEPPPAGLSTDEKGAWISWTPSINTVSAMRRKWPIAHRRCMGLKTLRLAWQRGCWITTPAALALIARVSPVRRRV